MKKKLRLQIETLRVERFDVHPDAPLSRGTVHGLRAEIGPSTPWDCDPLPDTMTCGYTNCC